MTNGMIRSFYAIMLQDEIDSSPDTYPIAEEALSQDDLLTIVGIDEPARRRLAKMQYRATRYSANKTYFLLRQGNRQVQGAIYRMEKVS